MIRAWRYVANERIRTRGSGTGSRHAQDSASYLKKVEMDYSETKTEALLLSNLTEVGLSASGRCRYFRAERRHTDAENPSTEARGGLLRLTTFTLVLAIPSWPQSTMMQPYPRSPLRPIASPA